MFKHTWPVLPVILILCGCSQGDETTAVPSGSPVWAQTAVAAADNTILRSVATDAGGNVYAAGLIRGTNPVIFASGVSESGTYAFNNAVLVKYDPTGIAQWARSVSTGTNQSAFTSVAVDANGNVYVAGSISNTGEFTFGTSPSVTARGTASGMNAVLVKYNSAGTAQWAQTVTTGSLNSCFNSVAVDAGGDVYAAGYTSGTGTFTFGTSPLVTAAGSYSGGVNVVLVKYTAAGTAQWARTVTSGFAQSEYSAVAADAAGNVYAAGYITNQYLYTFGTSPSVTALGIAGAPNIALVKYTAAGTAQWAQTVTVGPGGSFFNSLAVDGSGNVYAAGSISGPNIFVFAPSVFAAVIYNGDNDVLVKYNSSGVAQWAQTLTQGPSQSLFNSVALDADGNIYAAGHIYGTDTFCFGSSPLVTAAGAVSGSKNAVLLKYNSAGTAQWAQPVVSGSSQSTFFSIATDPSGNVYAAGDIDTTGAVGFSADVSAQGKYSGNNMVLVKYSR